MATPRRASAMQMTLPTDNGGSPSSHHFHQQLQRQLRRVKSLQSGESTRTNPVWLFGIATLLFATLVLTTANDSSSFGTRTNNNNPGAVMTMMMGTKASSSSTRGRVLLGVSRNDDASRNHQRAKELPGAIATDQSPRLRATSASASSASTTITAREPSSPKAATSRESFYQLTFDGLWQHFDCDDYFGRPQDRPVHHQTIWQDMREVYIQTIQPSASTQRRLRRETSAMQVPYSVRRVPAKGGLGLFAETDILNQTLVYDGDHGGHVTFSSSLDFHNFLWQLGKRSSKGNDNSNKNMACLALRCSAVESHTRGTSRPRDGAHIALDMDDGCFANTGPKGEEQNVGGTVGQRDFALRRITKGQELVWSYGDFVFPWKWFNM